MRLKFLILILISFYINSNSALVEDVLDVIHVVKEVTTGVLRAWDIVEQTNGIELPTISKKQKNVLKRMKELSRKIEYSEMTYENNALMVIESVNKFVKDNARLELYMFEVEDAIRLINARFKQMKKYAANREHLEEQTLIAFAEWSVSPNAYAINNLLEKLHDILVTSPESRLPNKNVFNMLSDSFEYNHINCNDSFGKENFTLGTNEY